MNGYPGFIDRLRKATLNVDIDTAKLLVEAANVIEDISSNWEPKSRMVVETVTGLDELPSTAVIRARNEYVLEKRIWGLHTTWLEMGEEQPTYSSLIELPAQILWMPEDDA